MYWAVVMARVSGVILGAARHLGYPLFLYTPAVVKKTVTGKQENSKHCFVCGLKNDIGIKARFYETGEKELVALFSAHELHQSYPGRLHGGISAATTNMVTINPTEPTTAAYGTPVTVTVQIPYSSVSWLPSPWFISGTTNLTASTVMRRETVQ